MEFRYRLAEKVIDRGELEELAAWLRTDPWLTMGPLVREFERRWAERVKTRRALFVNSGSSANLAMFAAALQSGRLRNKKVVVPAVSWATTVAPALQLGFEPLMCDAEPETLGLDPEALEALLKKHRPGAVIVVHVLGVPARMDELLRLKERYGFLLMEDACAATGSAYDGRPVGSFGDMSSFSFFYGHHLSTIEGGMVCTSDEALHDLLLEVRSHGWAKDLAPAKEARLAREAGALEFNRPFTFYVPGFNIRSTDLNAKLGLGQLAKADRVIARRAENHKLYQARFQEAEGFRCQRNDRAFISSIAFALLASSTEHRDRVSKALAEAGVEHRPVGGGNMSRQPFWRARYGEKSFPTADRLHAAGIQVPNHPGLSAEDVGFICGVIEAVRPPAGPRRRAAR